MLYEYSFCRGDYVHFFTLEQMVSVSQFLRDCNLTFWPYPAPQHGAFVLPIV